MQELISAASTPRRIVQPGDNNEVSRLRPLGAEKFFTPDQFAQANEWDAQRIEDTITRLSNTMEAYNPNRHPVPLFIAQMATFNYETVLNHARSRKRIISGDLDELTEYALVRVLEFNSQGLLRLPDIQGLGELTRSVSRQFKTLIEAQDPYA